MSLWLVEAMLATPAFVVELFRYRGAARDGGTLEYVFETDRQEVPATATKSKVAEIAADSCPIPEAVKLTEQRSIPDKPYLLIHEDASRGLLVDRKKLPKELEACVRSLGCA